MKANRSYRSKDPLEIMDTKIASSKCCHIQIQYTVDARHILLAITCLTEEDKKNPTRKMIEEQLRRSLFDSGERWYLSPIDYNEEGEHYNCREELEKAIPTAKKFFPEFMELPASVKFIRDLA